MEDENTQNDRERFYTFKTLDVIKILAGIVPFIFAIGIYSNKLTTLENEKNAMFARITIIEQLLVNLQIELVKLETIELNSQHDIDEIKQDIRSHD